MSDQKATENFAELIEALNRINHTLARQDHRTALERLMSRFSKKPTDWVKWAAIAALIATISSVITAVAAIVSLYFQYLSTLK